MSGRMVIFIVVVLRKVNNKGWGYSKVKNIFMRENGFRIKSKGLVQLHIKILRSNIKVSL